MHNLPDYELQRTVTEPDPTRPPPARRTGFWLFVAVFGAAAGAALYIAFRRPPLPPPVSPSRASAIPVSAPPPPRVLGGHAAPIAVPPLNASDPLVRKLVWALSSHSVVAEWLSGTNLIRNFAVVVVNIADGTSPARFLAALRPSLGFRTMESGGHVYLDPRSYDRYAIIANAVASIDPVAAARLYATLKPRIQEAYRDLGFPDRSFDAPLERAIVALLDTPVADDPIRLTRRPSGLGYVFTDARLERLTGAQKHLLRMGPRNVRIIKEQLRGIARALGVPSRALPSA